MKRIAAVYAARTLAEQADAQSPQCATCGRLFVPWVVEGICPACINLLPVDANLRFKPTDSIIEAIVAVLAERALGGIDIDNDSNDILTFPSTVVEGGAGARITVQSQIAVKPRILHVTESVGAAFIIKDILVGNKSQIPNTHGIPAEYFTPTRPTIRLDIDTILPAMHFCMIVQNRTAASAIFTALWQTERHTDDRRSSAP